MSSPALRQQLLETAAEVADRRPDVAVRLVELVREEDARAAQAVDVRERRRLLRLLRQSCYASLADTAAAHAIARAWRRWLL